MFKGKINFKSTELRYLNIRDFKVGMHTNGADGLLPKNSLSYIGDMDYSETGGLISRPALNKYTLQYVNDLNFQHPIFMTGFIHGITIIYKGNAIYMSSGNAFISFRSTDLVNTIMLNKNVSGRFVRFNSLDTLLINQGTLLNITTRSVVSNITNMSPNIYVGKYLQIGTSTEYKYITSNTNDTIFINGQFDNAYSLNANINIYDKVECLINVSQYSSLNNVITYKTSLSSKTIPNIHIGDIYYDRLFYSNSTNPDTLYFTEIGILDYTPKNNYFKFTGIIRQIKVLGNRLVVYLDNDIAFLYGSSANDFRIEYQLTSNTLDGVNQVANGNNAQFYMSKTGLQVLSYIDNKIMRNSIPISNGIKDYIVNNTNDTNSILPMSVFNNKVYICLGYKMVVYDIAMSQQMKIDLFSIYSFSEIEDNGTFPLSSYIISNMDVVNNQLAIGVKTMLYYFNNINTSNIKYYPYDTYNGKPLTIISNKLDFGSGFRNKIFRRLKYYLSTLNYTNNATVLQQIVKIYIKLDDGAFTLMKTSIINNDELFLSIKAKNITYKIEITPQNINVYNPIEITHIAIGYSLLSKM